MADIDKGRLLRLVITLDIDEASRQNIIAKIGRIQQRWSDVAKKRHVDEVNAMIGQARMQQRVIKQRQKDEQALNSQRSREYIASQRRRIRFEDNERAQGYREENKARRLQEQQDRRDKRKQQSASDALNNQRSRAYVRQQQQAEHHLHRMRMDHIREEERQRRRQQQAQESLERQRSRAYTRSQEVRHRAEMKNLRDRDREERKMLRRGLRHLRIGALGAGVAAGGSFYAFQNVLNERGREAIQLRGTSDALGIPLDDLQQLIYVARIMGLWFGPAELADAQNKMIEIQRDMKRYNEGDLPGGKLRIGARKLIEYGVNPEDATMANMLPIIELMAQGWLKGDREVMAALNNMFEEQVGKRVGVISTMMATGEWRNLLAADLLTAEEIEDVSRMYRQMILIMHEADVAMQRFLVGNKENVDAFMTDLRTMVHTTGELLNNVGFLGHIMGNLVPILVGIGAAMSVLALKIWGTAWAAAALSAATGQWHNIAMFAAVGLAAGMFTRFLLDKLAPSAEVEPPATKTGQVATVDAIEATNKKIQDGLDNILCVARNAEADAKAALKYAGAARTIEEAEAVAKESRGTNPAYALVQGLVTGNYDPKLRQDYTRWRELNTGPGMPSLISDFNRVTAYDKVPRSPTFTETLVDEWRRSQDEGYRPPNRYAYTPAQMDYPTEETLEDQAFSYARDSLDSIRNTGYPHGIRGPLQPNNDTPIQVNGDMNINVETLTDIDDAIRETDKYLKNNE